MCFYRDTPIFITLTISQSRTGFGLHVYWMLGEETLIYTIFSRASNCYFIGQAGVDFDFETFLFSYIR